MKKILLLFLSIIISACEFWDTPTTYSLRLYNFGNHPIGCYFSFKQEKGEFLYPDTSIRETDKNISHNINSGGMRIDRISIPWSELLSNLPKDTLSIFIFHTDTLNKYDWEIIKSQYKVLMRYDLSTEDLNTLKNDIPFPPTDEMKNMKIWP